MATNGRFLTTHVGSLPRPDDLIAMMWAREDGIPVDKAAMDERVCRAVDEVVARQANAGIDIVNDGKWGKSSYATYIKDRLNGFGGTGNTFVFLGRGVRTSERWSRCGSRETSARDQEPLTPQWLSTMTRPLFRRPCQTGCVEISGRSRQALSVQGRRDLDRRLL
jgi:methionine synthase II (cobalamin-independent)